MKKLLLFFALLAGGIEVSAQITEVLSETLKNKFTVGANEGDYLKLEESPSGYDNWFFENCYAMRDSYGDVWVQAGSTKTKGSITTPFLNGLPDKSPLSGNARVSVWAYMRDDDSSLKCQTIGNGWVCSPDYRAISKESWKLLDCFAIRGGNELTKIKFYTGNSEGADAIRRVQLANISVLDMGRNIYYETFDRNTSTGGNTGGFAPKVSSDADAKFDYTSSSLFNTKAADGCVYFYLAASYASYTTATIPVFNTSGDAKVKLTFRMAGDTDAGSTLHRLEFSSPDATVTPSNFEIAAGEWFSKEVVITNFKSNSSITFQGRQVFLDDVAIEELSTVSLALAQGENNGEGLTAAVGKVADVTLTRTLTPGYWNTLCLPFDFSTRFNLPTQMEGKTLEVKRLDRIEDGVFYFRDDTVVPAGEPFLIRVSGAVENPVFTNVPVRVSVPQPITSDGYSFAGTFSPTALNTNGTHLFLGTDGALCKPTTSGNSLPGLRAYFVVPEGESSARVSLSADESMSVADMLFEQPSATVYSLSGQPVDSRCAKKGIYIQNGKKFVVK